MICPHCSVAFAERPSQHYLGPDRDGNWSVLWRTCTNCGRLVVELGVHRYIKASEHPAHGILTGDTQGPVADRVTSDKMETEIVRPKFKSRPLSDKVPPEYRKDFLEAAKVLAISPKSSAALSRRCLQNLLENHANVKRGKLSDEIQEIIDRDELPSDLEREIDGIRAFGNFAAHPIKDTDSGAVVDVEEDEAEWNLDVLEDLFDHYFIKGAKRKNRIEAANKKLKDAGKPPLKGSTP
jgi:hypothetical protein